ncbi:glycosyltransferase [Streptomyces sp. SID6673]|nr:glycosyltransferase [Streptomyces sp. SID11726]NEB27322.1 glycosyltransferase [Streptomyces sp. SID6673]
MNTRDGRTIDELMADEDYRQAALYDAVERLRDEDAQMSASVPFSRGQKIIGLGTLAVIVVLLVVFPIGTTAGLVSIATVVYILALIDRVLIFRRGLVNGAIVITDEQARAIDDDDLPPYTVLVPAYGEPEVVGDLIGAMESLEYPHDKLQVLLLLEEDDEPTIAAAREVGENDMVTVVLVPPAQPRTKPKACNYGLHFATGDIVTIFDAEDLPDPLQLRRAVASFRASDDTVVCVQGKLNFHNSRDNVLTEWFTADYGIWFSYLLPGLMVSRAPIPLGGTSNHFLRAVLDDIGAWDPFNVTEDADLGVRIAGRGYRTAVLDSLTLEEANVDAINWVRQRSRWYKGYMQTWLVHMRRPVALWRILGPVAWYRFTLLIAGTPVIACMNMAFWLIMVVWLAGQPKVFADIFPGPIYYLSLVSLIFGNGAAIYMNLVSIREDGRSKLLWSALIVPAYWVLMSIAAIKGMWQMLFNPSYWEKTFHGLSSSSDDAADADDSVPAGAEGGSS